MQAYADIKQIKKKRAVKHPKGGNKPDLKRTTLILGRIARLNS
jgi:hypothetical protein